MKTVLVTGGAGYKGCILVPKLFRAGYAVVVYDLMLFGADGLPRTPICRSSPRTFATSRSTPRRWRERIL